MKLGETDPTLRRIYFTIRTLDGSTFATSVDGFSSPAPTVLVASNSNTHGAAAGTFAHVANETRLHYYEASAAEATVPGFILVAVTHPNIENGVAFAFDFVGPAFQTGTSDTTLMRYPFVLYDLTEPPAPVAGATVTTAADLQSSVNGGNMANETGSLVEIKHSGTGLGAYYFQGTVAAVATAGQLVVKYENASHRLAMEPIGIGTITGGGGGGDTSPPAIGTLTPTDGSLAPGSPGAFSASYGVARDTPIDVPIVDAASDLGYVAIAARFSDSPPWETVYMGRPESDGINGYKDGYKANSTLTGSGAAGVGCTFGIRRDGGWPGIIGLSTTVDLDIQASDTKGNVLA